jgi:acyl-CoA hydrolase/RimJ/RimL family protein N-acetyltransferase
MDPWKTKVVKPAKVLDRLEPGMSIFLGTGAAEPRTLVKHLTESPFLEDLELIQLVSFGDALSEEALQTHKYRLKTFFGGGLAAEAFTKGMIDVIPARFASIPRLIASRLVPIDVAFVQVTPPNASGYCCLGAAVDVARQAMEQASLVVGEMSSAVPRTFGDTFVHVSEIDLLVESTEPPLYVERWPVDEVHDQLATNVASVVENGSCVSFALGPLFDALAPHLVNKRHLGVHSPFFTDALMDLVESGAVTNRYKEVFRGTSVASYAIGTKKLMRWLDRNPLVEFQGLDKVFHPLSMGKNPRMFCVLPARKVDLTGLVALHQGRGNVAAGPGEAIDFINGAELSEGGLAAFALPSRNRHGAPNILLSVKDYPHQFSLREAVDMIVTEYGIAFLQGRTIRERAQALIDVAHPDDRARLVEQAREARILYQDQIFLADSAHLYPSELAVQETFGDVMVRFRAIKPSDEEEMRRLFYRFSDQAVYYRYFSPIKAMPHSKMQQYVNVDYRKALSIVGVVGEQERIIAEGRFVKHGDRPLGDIAFVVDEEYQGRGIATAIFKLLVQAAKERGLQGFTADVLASNKAMLKVFEKVAIPVRACLDAGMYELTMLFDARPGDKGTGIRYAPGR